MSLAEPAPGTSDSSASLSLAEFVGRLYLLLVTVVFDHPKWLPRDLRPYYGPALTAVYPAVYQLQAALLNPADNDERGAEEVARLLRNAGLSGPQLDLKLTAYRHAEARFYGGRHQSTITPDRRFEGQEEVWLLPVPKGDAAVDAMTRGGKEARAKAAVEPVFGAANIILGTLLSVFQVTEPYKEIKEGVEFGVKNWKLFGRAGRKVAGLWAKAAGAVRRGSPVAR